MPVNSLSLFSKLDIQSLPLVLASLNSSISPLNPSFIKSPSFNVRDGSSFIDFSKDHKYLLSHLNYGDNSLEDLKCNFL